MTRAEELQTLQPATCFACGTENPHGLHVSFTRTPAGSTGTFVPTVHHEGWPGAVHGGILVTLLDEAMAYALWFNDIRAVTARMEARFRKMVGAGQKLVINGEVVGSRRDVVDAVGRITVPDGTEVAQAAGRFKLADVSY